MTRARRTIVGVALVAVCGLGGPAPASAVVDPACLKDPVIGGSVLDEDQLPVLKSANVPVDVAVVGALLQNCPNTTVTAKTPGGGLITVPLNLNLPENPPDVPERLGGHLTIPVGYGAGTWHLTKITSGGSSKTLHHPFTVHRGGTVSLDAPATVWAPTQVAVSGKVWHYSSAGLLVPSPNTSVAIVDGAAGNPVLRRLTTNSAGAFSGTVSRPPGLSNFRAEVAPGTYVYTYSQIRTATVNQPFQDWIMGITPAYKTTAYVNEFWRVDGTTLPWTLWNDLQKPTTAGWVTTGSFGYSNALGQITRWWKPVSTGTYNLRVQLGKNGYQTNGPLYESVQVTVKSKQTIPTYVDATVKPTNGGTVYADTPMTAYGHLKVRYSNGTIGPFANQRVLVQARAHGETAWSRDLGAVTTDSNGYFLKHFEMGTNVDTDIRFLYLSPYVTIKNGSIIKSNIQVTP